MRNISIKLRKKREELGISREYLAEKSEVSSKTIQRAEDGEDLSVETIEKIEKALGVSLRQEYTCRFVF